MNTTNRPRPPRSASKARPLTAAEEARMAELTSRIQAAAAERTTAPATFAGWED